MVADDYPPSVRLLNTVVADQIQFLAGVQYSFGAVELAGMSLAAGQSVA